MLKNFRSRCAWATPIPSWLPLRRAFAQRNYGDDETYGCWTKNRGTVPPNPWNFNRVFRFSIINHRFWSTPFFGNTMKHPYLLKEVGGVKNWGWDWLRASWILVEQNGICMNLSRLWLAFEVCEGLWVFGDGYFFLISGCLMNVFGWIEKILTEVSLAHMYRVVPLPSNSGKWRFIGIPY